MPKLKEDGRGLATKGSKNGVTTWSNIAFKCYSDPFEI